MIDRTEIGPLSRPTVAVTPADNDRTEVSLRPPEGVWDYTTSVCSTRVAGRRRRHRQSRLDGARELRRTVRRQRTAITLLFGALLGVIGTVALVAIDLALNRPPAPAGATAPAVAPAQAAPAQAGPAEATPAVAPDEPAWAPSSAPEVSPFPEPPTSTTLPVVEVHARPPRVRHATPRGPTPDPRPVQPRLPERLTPTAEPGF